MLGAGAISIFRAREKTVVAARGGARMVVSVTLDLVIAFAIVAVLILVIVRAHRLMIVRAILRADQRRGQPAHRES